MKNRYYTPKKEDLHCGFKCETYSILTISGFRETYKEIKDWKPLLWNPSYGYREDSYRVKFLCEKDITSKGFNLINNDLDYARWVNTESFEDGLWSEYYQRIRVRFNWFDDGHALVSVSKIPVHDKEQLDNIDWSSYDKQERQFCGKIKNISDFNRILDSIVEDKSQ